MTRDNETEEFAGWYDRGYLQHYDAERCRQFVTYRLADSLPRHALQEMRNDHEPEEFERRCQRFLDNGPGSCLLGDPRYASVVKENLEHHDGSRFRLNDWIIMPNHVHVDFYQIDPLPKILHSLKSYTSKEILKRLQESGDTNPFEANKVWYRSYFDRRIRDERHAFAVKCYIYLNPVRAGLVDHPLDWEFSSIHQYPSEFHHKIDIWYRRWKERFYQAV